MIIEQIEAYPVHIPLHPKVQMVSALGRHDTSHYVLIRIVTDSGLEGAGEATVTARWSGETIWSVMALVEHVFGPRLRGEDPCDIPRIAELMDLDAMHNWFAKSAIEMACWDLKGKLEQKPVYELLGGACRERTIRSRFSMGAYDVERARKRAAELIELGFQTIKVKVGGDPDEDIRRVRAVREVIGPDRPLVIDANCGWDADTAIGAVKALSDCRIAIMEQPTPRGDFESLARVRRAIEPEVMADDICFNLTDAQELVRNQACQIISVYPGKNGGIAKSKQIVEFAEQHGLACTIGSNLELDVAAAAMGHLALACPNLQMEKIEGDMYGPQYHVHSVVKDSLVYDGPNVTIPDRPGLGVEVDWDRVRDQSLRPTNA